MAGGSRRERKVVTVLFADLVGFTSRAEQMDPEDVAAELARYQARVRAELERYGGTVEKFIGDAVMAIFGAPKAHEDDPERAVRAALAICDWAAHSDIEMRVGISTGEALVTLEAAPERGETMAAGDVVNTAARLQTAAAVNAVLVGEHTYRATRLAIDYDPQQLVSAKGKSNPVPAYRPVGSRARVTVERVHGASLTGRDRELQLLQGSLERSRAARSPQLVTLVGVPGIGKSRLVLELFEQIEAEPDLTSWRQGRCLPYGEGITFWALGEMVKAQLAILDGDDAETAEEKLAAVDDDWVRSHLRPLLGLSTAAGGVDDHRDEAFAAWRQFFETMAEQRPLVLVFEDLHWADDDLLDFVDYLVEWAGAVPLLVVCTARPELLVRRPGWGGGKANALTVSLSPLSDEEMSRLLAELLDRSLVLADVQAQLLASAGGNPLYAEEYARMIGEKGGIEALPQTVQGIIAARLDLLEIEQKSLLQDAAVIGKRFWSGALAALADDDLDVRLHALQRKEFIQKEQRASVADETEWAFRHLLVRDVAYAQIPRADRVDKHRRVAAWIESLGRREDHAEMLAHHYLQALELATQTGVDTAQFAPAARRSLADAGDRAAGLNAWTAAARYYRAALSLAGDEDGQRGRLMLRLGRTLLLGGEPDAAVLEDARDVSAAAGDFETAGDAEAALAELYWFRGDRDSCFEHLSRAREIVRPLPPSFVKAHTIANASRFMMLASEDQEAVTLGLEALAMAELLGLDAVRAEALNNVGSARLNLGDRSGLADLESATAVAEQCGAVFEICRGKGNRAANLWMRGELAEALRLWREAEQVADRYGHRQGTRWYRSILAKALSVGEWDDALRRATTLIDEVEAGSPHYLASQCYLIRALVRLGRDDDPGAAYADAEKAFAVGRRARDPQAVYKCSALAAFVFLEVGDRDRAASAANEYLTALQQRQPLGAAIEEAYIASLTLTELGRGAEIAAALAGFDQPWTRAGVTFAEGDPLAAAAVLAAMGARTEEAQARLRAARLGELDQLDAALTFFRQVGAMRYVREAESLLTHSA